MHQSAPGKLAETAHNRYLSLTKSHIINNMGSVMNRPLFCETQGLKLMYVDLWGWFWQEEVRAFQENDDTVKRIVELARQGWTYRRSAQSSLMLASFEEAAGLARQHQNPCWELFCTYWACSTLFYHVDDLQGALDRTVKLISRSHHDELRHCPIRSRVYFLLADIYYEIDVFGYEDKIRESLNFLENNIPMDEDTYLRLQHRFADLAYLHEDYDDAFERVTRYMAKAEENEFRMRSAHQLLRAIAFARGDIATAYEHCIHAEQFARNIQSHVDIGVAVLWQAVLSKRQGNDTLAAAKYLQGTLLFATHDLPHWPDYYNAICDYLEICGHPGEAKIQRQRQLTEYSDYGSVFYLSLAHLQNCRLAGRIGDNLAKPLEAAYTLSDRMLKPEKYLARVQKIENGDYYEFDWQRNIAEK